jgi:hypothetical protein
MTKPEILISLRTQERIIEHTYGRSIIGFLMTDFPELAPEWLSLDESYKNPFLNLEHFVENWWAVPRQSYNGYDDQFEGCLWKRKSRVKSFGDISHGGKDISGQYSPSYITFRCLWDTNIDFHELFKRWVELLPVDIGMLHVFTDNERPENPSSDMYSFQSGTFGGPARPGIPDIAWAMAYSTDSGIDVNISGLENAGYRVETCGDTHIVYVTDQLSNVISEFENFAYRRMEMKPLFKADTFRSTVSANQC